MSEERTIETDTLGSMDGIRDASVKMAEVVCMDVLWPVVMRTPPHMRQQLFKRFMAAVAGAVVAELGPEETKKSLDAVKVAVDDFAASQARAHAH